MMKKSDNLNVISMIIKSEFLEYDLLTKLISKSTRVIEFSILYFYAQNQLHNGFFTDKSVVKYLLKCQNQTFFIPYIFFEFLRPSGFFFYFDKLYWKCHNVFVKHSLSDLLNENQLQLYF